VFAGTPVHVEAQSLPDWGGVHVGVHAGIVLGQGTARATEDSEGVPYNEFGDTWTMPVDGSTKVGFRVGYGVQRQALLFGVDLDLGEHGFSGSAASELSEDTVASSESGLAVAVRGRVGYAVQRLLLYGTAGFINMQLKASVVDSCADDPCGQVRIDAAGDGRRNGATFGIGAEYALTRVSRVALSLTGEWVMVNVDGSVNVSGVDDFGDSHGWDVTTSPPSHALRIGVSARFR
jgi:outer membrane immunogenic protein